MNELDQKINAHFPGLVVRKDLVKTVKGNAIVPSFVLEYLLGQYCASNDEATIRSGIETVREILGKHFVHRMKRVWYVPTSGKQVATKRLTKSAWG